MSILFQDTLKIRLLVNSVDISMTLDFHAQESHRRPAITDPFWLTCLPLTLNSCTEALKCLRVAHSQNVINISDKEARYFLNSFFCLQNPPDVLIIGLLNFPGSLSFNPLKVLDLTVAIASPFLGAGRRARSTNHRVPGLQSPAMMNTCGGVTTTISRL